MSARLRHGIYYAVSAATILPIILLELGGKLANRMEWVLWDLQRWAWPRPKGRRPGQ